MEEQGRSALYLPRDWKEIPDFDVVVNLSAYGNYYDQTGEKTTYQVNLGDTIMLALETVGRPYSAFIQIGSSSELGRQSEPMAENANPRPETYYATSKLAGTHFCQVFARKNDKPIVVVRPFSVTGVGEQSKHLIPTLIRSCLYGEEMKFVGEPVHDFIDIEDLIDAIVLLSKHAEENKGEVFHVGSGRQYSNEEVKLIVESSTGKNANIIRVPSMRSYDSECWVADNRKIKSLGWRPRLSLEDSIRRMVKHEQV